MPVKMPRNQAIIREGGHTMPRMTHEWKVDAGPCKTCGHPPRCHPSRLCDAQMYTNPCDHYDPDPANRILIDAPEAVCPE